jgi:hypothetical protein
MAAVSHAVSIPAAPERVFPWMLDVDKVPLWVEGVSAYDLIGGGELGQGARLRQTLTVSGFTMTAEAEVVAYDPPGHAATRSVSNGIAVRIDYRVDPEGDGSRVTQSIELEPQSLKARMIAPMVRGQMDAKLPADLERLRQRLS